VQLIHCTQKLLKELGQKPVANIEPIKSILGSWHANFFLIERRKCVLVTNDNTFYTLFIPYLKKQDFQHFNIVFGQSLFKNLLHENFTQRQIEVVLEENRKIIFARTNNRSILGSMNDQKVQLEYRIYYQGGLENTAIYDLNKELNRNLLKAIDYQYPIELLKERLKAFE